MSVAVNGDPPYDPVIYEETVKEEDTVLVKTKLRVRLHHSIRAVLDQISNPNFKCGREVTICEGVTVTPSWLLTIGECAFIGCNVKLTIPRGLRPVTIGGFTIIGDGSVSGAQSIGTCVDIGRGCIIGEGSLIGDGCILAPGTVLPPFSVCLPGTVWAGSPGKAVRSSPAGIAVLMEERAQDLYDCVQTALS